MQLSDDIRALLQCAVSHLNEGNEAAAEASLNRIARLDPHNPQAIYLSGLIQFERSEWSAAETLFRRAHALSPTQPQVAFHLSQTLRALRRPQEALAIASAAHENAPQHAGLWLEIAKSQQESGALDAAVTTCRQLRVQHPGDVAAAILLAQLFASSGKRADAERVLRETLARAADRPIVADDRARLLYELAVTLRRCRRHREALECLDNAATVMPAQSVTYVERASVLQHLQRFDEAAQSLRAGLQLDPTNFDAHVQLNEILYRHERDEQFLKSYDEAAERIPSSAQLPAEKGQWLLQLGRAEEALPYFERARSIDPDSPQALAGLQRTLEALHRLPAAISQLEENLRRHPRDAALLVESAGLLLRAGEATRARNLAAKAHQIDPSDQTSLAVLGLCLRELNLPEEFALNGYDSLVQVYDLAPPAGYRDMTAFNQELAAYLESLHGDRREYFTQTARGGTRVFDEVFDNGHALIDRLKVRIDEAVGRYIASLGEPALHPFVKRRTRAFTYNGSWSSTLRDRGFHVNHIHAAGWISSAYYVSVPAVVADTQDRQGWLKFGEPSALFGGSFTPRRLVQPSAGRLVLFPSYLWHGTTPFRSAQTRTTIAFDVLPARQS